MQKIFKGTVVSVKMGKTAVVEVARKKPHPLYKKLMRVSKKYKVDSGNVDLHVGDIVRIVATKPISKDKHFKILEEGK